MSVNILNIPRSLNLKNVGVLEMVFALTPILIGYGLGSVPLSVLMWLILILLALIRKGRMRMKNFMPLTLFVIYWAIHDVIMIFIDDKNLNGILANAICFASIYFLYPVIDMKKLRGSLNWVTLISIVGLLYQWIIISAGGGVHPIEIPGLSMPENRLEGFSARPSSFFMEPASYVSFVICPLALSLIDRKYIWSIVIILSIFLSTSTTGLIISFLMLGLSFFGQRKKVSTSVILLVIGIGLFYALTHFVAFDTGVEKLQNTDTETNVRLRQGPYVVGTMQSSEYIFGVPYSSAYKYCRSGRATNVAFYGENVFMATFWDLLLCYGVVGLLLYINIYWRLIKRYSKVIPFVACAAAMWFSGGYGIQGLFAFSTIFLLVLSEEYNEVKV